MRPQWTRANTPSGAVAGRAPRDARDGNAAGDAGSANCRARRRDHGCRRRRSASSSEKIGSTAPAAGRAPLGTGGCIRSRTVSARSSRRHPPGHGIHRGRHFGVAHGCRALFRNPDHIAARSKAATFPPECLPDETFYAISHDGRANLAGDRHAQSNDSFITGASRRLGRRRGRYEHEKVAQVELGPCALNLKKLPALPYMERRREAFGLHLPPIVTVRRLRPRRRRAASTLRPLAVALRARNPWVRERLRLWGWYVRFMGRTSVSGSMEPTAARHASARPRSARGRIDTSAPPVCQRDDRGHTGLIFGL